MSRIYPVFGWIKRVLVGPPLPCSAASQERFTRVTGLAVLSSDALSSMKTYSHIRREALNQAAAALEPSKPTPAPVVPAPAAAAPTAEKRVTSQPTSQERVSKGNVLDFPKKNGSSGWIRNRWRQAQRGAALPERQPGGQLREREVGSSGWIRTNNPPVNRLTRVVYLVGSSWV